jgi:hypothetical protein
MITIIWHSNRENSWEKDWIEYLFAKTPHHTITDYSQELIIPNSLIVYNASVNIQKYLERAQGTRFGLIHLSDEWGTDDTSLYSYAQIVFRNYYKDLGPNVINFPLGCMKGIPYDRQPKTIKDRSLTWSFSGHVDKTTRPEMAKWMVNVPNGKYYFKKCGQNWGAFEGHKLNPIDLFDMYSDSLFVPCPRGNQSIDSLRVCEALEAGSIPIVERNEYWQKLYGADNPLVQIDSWSFAPSIINMLLSDLTRLEYQRQHTHKWWKNHCVNLQEKIADLL